MKEKSLRFACGELSLEGVACLPEEGGLLAAVVVCHPHSLYGGNMDSNVVLALCRALCQASIVAFRFNFRGVGGSQGEFGQGIAEREDAEAAISFVSTMEQVDPGRIGLCGYSFGASVAFPVAVTSDKVRAVALISPPISAPGPELLAGYYKPKLLVCGSRDEFVPLADFQSLADGLPEPKECQVISGADHFWLGYEAGLAAGVAAFFADNLKLPPSH